jgi:hypothetical protein
MAKAKPKTDEGADKNKAAAESKASAAKPKAAAKKAAAPASAKKAAKPGAGSAAPLIDTNLAAQAAATMVFNRDRLGANKAPTGEKKESGSFKQMKESLLKPAVQGPGGLLTNPNPQKKSNQGFGGRNQVGHNQTFGADVNRAGVPRRTGGG